MIGATKESHLLRVRANRTTSSIPMGDQPDPGPIPGRLPLRLVPLRAAAVASGDGTGTVSYRAAGFFGDRSRCRLCGAGGGAGRGGCSSRTSSSAHSSRPQMSVFAAVVCRPLRCRGLRSRGLRSRGLRSRSLRSRSLGAAVGAAALGAAALGAPVRAATAFAVPARHSPVPSGVASTMVPGLQRRRADPRPGPFATVGQAAVDQAEKLRVRIHGVPHRLDGQATGELDDLLRQAAQQLLSLGGHLVPKVPTDRVTWVAVARACAGRSPAPCLALSGRSMMESRALPTYSAAALL